MKIPYFFISYHHEKDNEDKNTEKLTELLEALELEYFIDTQIESGEDIKDRIDKEITKSTYMLVLISGGKLDSDWQHAEIESAERKGVKVIPILAKHNITPPIRFDRYKKYFSVTCSNPKEEFIRMLIKNGFTDEGIVPIGIFMNYNKLFPNEQIAAELLTQPISLRKTNNELEIVIDRNDTTHVVISNRGKNKLCSDYVNNKDELINLDIHFHNLLSGKTKINNKDKPIKIPLKTLPLRWCSGGILSIVHFKDRYWVPLFFRDIKPDGWNLSLGASERRGEDLSNYWESELMDPWKLIIREFLEETLILAGHPEPGYNKHYRRFNFENMETEIPERWATAFSEKHLKLRRKYDDLRLNYYNEDDIHVRVKSGIYTKLTIEKNGRHRTLHDVIVSFNLLELGIEVIKVIEYSLDNKNYMLDGEILEKDEENEKMQELVRMPFALLSLDYLKQSFGKEEFKLEYTKDNIQPSIQGGSLLNENDIHLFDWDIKRRIEIMQDGPCQGDEKRRYEDWARNYNKFEDFKKIPPRFTPATAKVLNIFFNSHLYNPQTL